MYIQPDPGHYHPGETLCRRLSMSASISHSPGKAYHGILAVLEFSLVRNESLTPTNQVSSRVRGAGVGRCGKKQKADGYWVMQAKKGRTPVK